MYDHILVRYGELGLKGKNRQQFIKTLARNIRRQLKSDLGEAMTVTQEQGRLFIVLDGRKADDCYPSLDRVFGISSYSPVRTAPLDEDAIIQAAIDEMKAVATADQPFRITAKRANKRFPIPSMDLQLRVAERLLAEMPHLTPNLTDYALELRIEVRADAAYLFVDKRPGLGGLPTGTGGRALFLLSGGIDSPVAGWSIMRRGVVAEAVHFHSYPYTSVEAEEKVLQLAERLAAYTGHVIVHLVPFTRIQEDIGQHCHDNLRITLMRRFMLRIAEQIAEARRANALITGDNLGQVASQTIESLRAINAVTTLPILRPLIAMDKIEIIRQAEDIDTYETSILPYEDCCTVFVPKEPKTRPSTAACEREERHLSVEELVQDAVAHTDMVVCYGDGRARIRKPMEDISQQ